MVAIRLFSADSTRQRNGLFKKCFLALCIFAICMSGWMMHHEKLRKELIASFNFTTNSHQSITIRSTKVISFSDRDFFHSFQTEPRFLLFNVDNQQQPLCKSVYEEIIPSLKSFNISNEDFVQVFFGQYLNPVYITHSNTNDILLNMTGKYCSNTTHQWMLFNAYSEGIRTLLLLLTEVAFLINTF